MLEVNNLHVRLQTQRGPAEAVRGVSFSLERGETLGLIGESGCGKSITAMALMGLLPEQRPSAAASARRPGAGGQARRELCRIRGNRIGMIFQEPMTALNPVHSIGARWPSRCACTAACRRRGTQAGHRLLDRVGIPNAARRIDAYPHQFSGGQRQRITIAMALACGPDLLIADEPTTALDVTIQQQILDLIQRAGGRARHGADADLARPGRDRAERGPHAGDVRRQRGRKRPDRRGVRGTWPTLHAACSAPGPAWARRAASALTTIAGTVPELVDLPAGCPFAGRCRHRARRLPHHAAAGHTLEDGHQVRCLRLDAVAAELQAEQPHDDATAASHDLVREYTLPREKLWARRPPVKALRA
jgi:peptide/nickel transport system ATP-binding protein